MEQLFQIFKGNPFSLVGFSVVVLCVTKCLVRLRRFYVGHFTKPAVDFKSLGKYAVITGATDGIGKVRFIVQSKRHYCRHPSLYHVGICSRTCQVWNEFGFDQPNNGEVGDM